MFKVRGYESFELFFKLFWNCVFDGVCVWIIVKGFVILRFAFDWQPVWLLGYLCFYLFLTFEILLVDWKTAICWRLLVECRVYTAYTCKGSVFSNDTTLNSNFDRFISEIRSLWSISHIFWLNIAKSCLWFLLDKFFHARYGAEGHFLFWIGSNKCSPILTNTFPTFVIIVVNCWLHLDIDNIVSAWAQHFFFDRVSINMLSRANIEILFLREALLISCVTSLATFSNHKHSFWAFLER